jgi:hypothetical protein
MVPVSFHRRAPPAPLLGVSTASIEGARPSGAALFGDLHGHVAASEHVAVQRRDGRRSLLFGFKSDEAEPSRTSGFPVEDDFGVGYGAMLRERFPEVLVVGGPGQPTNEEPIVHSSSLLPCAPIGAA